MFTWEVECDKISLIYEQNTREKHTLGFLVFKTCFIWVKKFQTPQRVVYLNLEQSNTIEFDKAFLTYFE